MLPTGTIDWAGVDVAVPSSSVRLPGVNMAGFAYRAPALADIAMVTHPSLTVLIDLSEDEAIISHAHGRGVRGSVVAGLAPGDFRVTGRGVRECLQIRLDPVAAAALLDASADLNGTAVSLEEVWGRDTGRTEDRLRHATSWGERFTTAAGLLRRRLGARPSVAPEVAHAWRQILTDRGRTRVEDLAAEVGWSRKRLWSRFRTQLGITPKRASRLVRFDHAAHLLAAGHDAASAAIESGYVDQSHLHREVKAFTGLTPTTLATAPWLSIDDIAWPTPSRLGRRASG